FLPVVSLEFLTLSQSKQWEVNRALTLVGRKLPCKVRLQSRSVSRVHCALLLTRQGLWVVDLLGRNGICVNGQPVRWALLQDGAWLQIGRFHIRICYQQTIQPIASSSNLGVLELDEDRYAPGPLSVVTRVNGQAPVRSQEPGLLTLLPRPLPPSLAAMPEGLPQQMLAQFQQSMLMMAQMLRSMHRDQLDLLNEALNRICDMDRQIQDLRIQLHEPTDVSGSIETNRPAESESLHANEEDSASLPNLKSASPDCPLPPTDSPAAKVDPADYHTWLNRRMQALHKERQNLLQRIISAVVGK